MTYEEVKELKEKIKNLDFTSWLDENATTTADVAGFARPLFSKPFERNKIAPLLNEKDKKKKKSKKKKKH